MTTIVTGITGYIGKNLIKHILEENSSKIILTYRKKKLKIKKKNIMWRKIDIKKNINFDFKTKKSPDSLIYLAWDGLTIKDYQSDIHLNQVDYHFNFISKLVENGLKNVVIAGSCFEYGNYNGEITENFKSKPLTKYGQAKNILRKKLFNLKNKFDFNLTWLRIFYFYGGKELKNDLWGNLNLAVRKKKKLFKINNGSTLRDYLHIDDVTNYIWKLNSLNKNLGIINICSNSPISVKKLVNEWKKEYNWKIKINSNRVPVMKHEQSSYWGSNKKLKSIMKKNKTFFYNANRSIK